MHTCPHRASTTEFDGFQVERIGKYKSAGDSLKRSDMSDAQKEALSAILEDVYGGFVSRVSDQVRATSTS